MEEEHIDSLFEIFEEIIRKANDGYTIIVEGREDESVLRKLGITGTIIRYSERGLKRTLEDLETNENSKVIILTDFDEEGEKICKELEKRLQSIGISFDQGTREKLKRNLTLYSKTVEGIRPILCELLYREEIRREVQDSGVKDKHHGDVA